MSCRYTAQGTLVCDKKQEKPQTSSIEHFAMCKTGCEDPSWFSQFQLANKQKINIPKACTGCMKQGDVSVRNCKCPVVGNDKYYVMKEFPAYAVPKQCRGKGYVNYNQNTTQLECDSRPTGFHMCNGYPNPGEHMYDFQFRTDCFEDEQQKNRLKQMIKNNKIKIKTPI